MSEKAGVMRAHLHLLHSPDLIDMRRDRPADPENCSIFVQAMIGPDGLDSYESFGFVICTPKWISSELAAHGYMFGRHWLVVEYYSYDVVWKAVEGLCQRTWGSNWDEVATKLSRYGQWEFESYEEFRP